MKLNKAMEPKGTAPEVVKKQETEILLAPRAVERVHHLGGLFVRAPPTQITLGHGQLLHLVLYLPTSPMLGTMTW